MKCVRKFERDSTFSDDGNLPFIPLHLESHAI